MPTRDIHMKQVGLKEQWDYILEEFVGPLQQRVFIGYVSVRHSFHERSVVGGWDAVHVLCASMCVVCLLNLTQLHAAPSV